MTISPQKRLSFNEWLAFALVSLGILMLILLINWIVQSNNPSTSPSIRVWDAVTYAVGTAITFSGLITALYKRHLEHEKQTLATNLNCKLENKCGKEKETLEKELKGEIRKREDDFNNLKEKNLIQKVELLLKKLEDEEGIEITEKDLLRKIFSEESLPYKSIEEEFKSYYKRLESRETVASHLQERKVLLARIARQSCENVFERYSKIQLQAYGIATDSDKERIYKKVGKYLYAWLRISIKCEQIMPDKTVNSREERHLLRDVIEYIYQKGYKWIELPDKESEEIVRDYLIELHGMLN